MPAPDPATMHHHEVVVVGSGFSVLAQARELRNAGIDDVVVLEKDAPPDSSPPLADDHDLHRRVRSGQELVAAGWDEETRTWTVSTRHGDVWVCRFFVIGLGAEEVGGLDVTGRDGRTLRATWAEHGVATHLGITVSDFPNLFLLPGHKSQFRYVRRAIETVRSTGMSGLDVRAEVQQRSHAARVGRTVRPATVRSWFAIRRFDPEDFELFGRAADAARAETDDGGRVSRTTATDEALLHDGGDEDAVAPVEASAREATPTAGTG